MNYVLLITEMSNQRFHSKFTVISSQRGNDLLLYNGYKYNKQRVNLNGHTVWRCSKRKKCNVTLISNGELVIKEEKHKCEASEVDNEVRKKISKCIERAKNETTPVPSIYAEVVEEFNNSGFDLVKKMPSYENLKKTLYKHRLKALQAKRTRFHRVEKVEVPGVFKQFLLADYMEKKNRVLRFASPKGRETLKTAKHFFGDGTFKSAPPPFTQLYAIHADTGSTEEANGIVPVCYAFLPNKKQKTYEIMFNLLKSQVPEMNPKTFTTDYESSAMLAIRETFRDVKSQGCFFHFSRACWRKAEKLGLRKTKILKSHVRRAISLAYLPKDFVMDGWLYVKGETGNNEKVTDFNNYFESTWLGKKSLFADKWCFYKTFHRTNNANESWNGRLNKKISAKPNIATLLRVLHKDSNYYFGLLRQKGFISKKRAETIITQRKIEHCVQELCDGEISVGYCIEKLSNI